MKRPKTPLPCPAPVPPRSLRFPEDHLYEKWGSVVLQPPNVADWDGAFVSSTSRLVLPVDEIEYEVDGKPMKKEFPVPRDHRFPEDHLYEKWSQETRAWLSAVR